MWQSDSSASPSTVFTKAHNRGIAAITIDGVDKGYIDAYSANTVWRSSIMYTMPETIHDIHTFNITITGRKNASADGTYTDVDQFTPLASQPQPQIFGLHNDEYAGYIGINANVTTPNPPVASGKFMVTRWFPWNIPNK